MALILISVVHAAAGGCGFSRLLEQHVTQTLGKKSLAAAPKNWCTPEQINGTVETKETEHFRIHFTRTGPHRVLGYQETGTPPFIDTLAHYLERAWDMHVEYTGMRAPRGMSRSHHYRQTTSSSLYPVEVLDLGLMRDTWDLLGGPCGACYGLVLPNDPSDDEATTLLIDNDFIYQASYDPVQTINTELGSCEIIEATKPLESNGKDYSVLWKEALEVTAFHELYHSVQLRYLDFRISPPSLFWFEASAVGVEEIGAPDVDDYLQYLPSVFNQPGTPITGAGSNQSEYGQSTLYHWLRHTIGDAFDKDLWTSLGRTPMASFGQHLASIHSHPDSLFHQYALHLFLTGPRHDLEPNADWAADRPLWPAMRLRLAPVDIVAPEPYAYRYLRLSQQSPSFWPQNTFFEASILQWDEGSEFASSKTVTPDDDLFLLAGQADTTVLVLSKLSDQTSIPSSPIAARSWPNPWRGNGSLCFGPAAETTDFLEIRSTEGYLILTLPVNSATTCWDGRIQGSLAAPGLYRWRFQGQGKLQTFVVVR